MSCCLMFYPINDRSIIMLSAKHKNEAKMEITTQNKKLFDSQSFLALGLGETRIRLGSEPESVDFILDFKDNKEESTEKITFDPIDNKTLRIVLTNWNNPIGATLNKEVEVGTLNKRRLYILFYIKKAGTKGDLREVTFSAYLGEEIQDGEN